MPAEPTFRIGDVPVYGDTMLAPMAGFSDVPHRLLSREYGAALSYTEFVAAEEILNRNERAARLLDFNSVDRPIVFQIFGNDAYKILHAAQIIEELNPDVIDVNMGCSTRRVSGRGAGVGMMLNPQLIAETFCLLTQNLEVPVSGKIRLGWEANQNFLDVGRILEENGASLIVIHPRTKEQKYNGQAKWDAIAELKQAVKVPVIGNGDIKTPGDIDRMREETKCDAVMIGRGAIGNPWLFCRRNNRSLMFSVVADTIRHHLALMVDYYGEYGLVLFKKYVKRYLGRSGKLAEFQRRLIQAESGETFLEILTEAETAFGDFAVEALSAPL